MLKHNLSFMSQFMELKINDHSIIVSYYYVSCHGITILMLIFPSSTTILDPIIN